MKQLQCLLILFSILIMGCGDGYTPPKLFKTKGTVTYQGKAIPEGAILFLESEGKGKPYIAQVKNGEYAVELPALTLKATITASRPNGKKEPNADNTGTVDVLEQYLPKEYNEETTLTATVKASDDNVVNFDLK